MRQLPLPLLFMAALISVFMACKKEVTLESTDRGVVKDDLSGGDVRPGVRGCMERVRLECGMLSFADQDHYQLVYDCLEAAYEAHLDGFEAQYGYLSEDDFNDMADQLGFVDEQPLIDFEGVLGFTSWRAQYDAALDAFIDAGGDPEQFGQADLFADVVSGTLHNEHGAVMIAGVIYLIDRHYRAWSFCSCEKYEGYLADPTNFENIEDDDCVDRPKTEFEGLGFTCRDHWKSCWWESLSNDRKVNQTLSFYYGAPSPVGRTVAQAAMKGFKYKYRFNRGWRFWPHRIRMKVIVEGLWRSTECREQFLFDNSKGFRVRKQMWVNRGPAAHYTFVDGEIKGRYWYPGSSNSRDLYHTYSGCP